MAQHRASRHRIRIGAPVAILWMAACASALASRARPVCDPNTDGITLPAGFCLQLLASDLGPVRHAAVAPNGDIFLAVRNTRDAKGGVLALRDTTGDGKPDVRERFGENGGTGIALRGAQLYFGTDDAILRYRLTAGGLRPSGPPDTIVSGLPAERSHQSKALALGAGNALYVNVGSPSNSCQVADRQLESPGQDPCPELQTRAGIWRFDANRLRQTQRDGERFATGIRNSVAITTTRAGALYVVQHGRDQLAINWPRLYTPERSAESPAEELLRVERGDDYGWPYCYYDMDSKAKVLAPEYGGNGSVVGRCASAKPPLVTFPGHWAPNGVVIYEGTRFPARYRGGAFIAFHGSWNRAPLPQAGYKVAFVPFANGQPTGGYEIFADGFAGENPQPNSARSRPTGLAVAPDGSLLITDDKGGKVWRVMPRE